MTKLYYIDPLKAAWMATEFGVIYSNINHGLLLDKLWYWGNIIKSWDGNPLNDGYRRKFEIHPDSHHIFEPKEEDVVEIDRWYWSRMRGEPFEPYIIPAKIIFYGKYMEISIPGHSFESWKPNEGEKPAMPYEIIQRDGKAFFMPEVENE